MGEEGAEFRNVGLGHTAVRADAAECFLWAGRRFKHFMAIDLILIKRCDRWTVISMLLLTKTGHRVK